jgi:hypothetical protein
MRRERAVSSAGSGLVRAASAPLSGAFELARFGWRAYVCSGLHDFFPALLWPLAADGLLLTLNIANSSISLVALAICPDVSGAEYPYTDAPSVVAGGRPMPWVGSVAIAVRLQKAAQKMHLIS